MQVVHFRIQSLIMFRTPGTKILQLKFEALKNFQYNNCLNEDIFGKFLARDFLEKLLDAFWDSDSSAAFDSLPPTLMIHFCRRRVIIYSANGFCLLDYPFLNIL